MKTKVTTILIAAALILCAWWLFSKGCSKPAPVSPVRDIVEAVKTADPYWKHKYDSLNLAMQAQQKTTDSLKRVVTINGSRVNASSTFIKKLIDRKPAVTTPYCDSLATLTAGLIEQVAQQDSATTQMIASCEAQLVTKDTALAARVEQYNQLRAGFDGMAASYDALSVAYAKSNRQVKVQRTIGRVLAGAVIVLAGKIILSK